MLEKKIEVCILDRVVLAVVGGVYAGIQGSLIQGGAAHRQNTPRNPNICTALPSHNVVHCTVVLLFGQKSSEKYLVLHCFVNSPFTFTGLFRSIQDRNSVSTSRDVGALRQ